MSTRVKICGITRLEDARYCAAAGADYLGFIQYEGSPRYVEPRAAREIIDWVYGPETVGVFVNASPDDVNRIADEAGFSYVQLHGTEPPAHCARVERPVIKALSVAPGTTTAELEEQMERYAAHVDAFLLDTRKAGLWGGTGEPFDWQKALSLSERYRLFVAGGIDAANVATVIETLQPYAVDVSSSVESAPGVKDFDRLAGFFEAFGAFSERSGG